MIFFLTKIQLYWKRFRGKNFDSQITLIFHSSVEFYFLKKGGGEEEKK